MSEIWFYLNEGLHHILDIDGLDHFYFILSFCLLYTFKDWRLLLGLITAFTVGHCITLFLSGLDLVRINSNTIELLIPITILMSCLNNFWLLAKDKTTKTQFTITYSILLVFGLIHGLGFSNYIKMLIFDEESIVLPLLGFNIGIEIAQILIVIVFLILIETIKRLKAPMTSVKLVINSVLTLLVLRMIFLS